MLYHFIPTRTWVVGDTLVGTLRDTYGDDFAQGYRSDAQLGTVLDREGLDDLSELLKKKP
jgi:hypothetical protein